LIGGWRSGSASLLGDATDFLGDAANYGISLFVLSLAPIWRPRSALFKGLTMAGFGFFVLATAAWHLISAKLPEARTMGIIGVAALAANGLVAALLFAYRNGDSDMRAVWLCTRNDVVGNLAVIGAALGVRTTGGNLPDLVVATIMGTMSLTSARSIIALAFRELKAFRIEAMAAAPTDTVELKRR